jgi:putative ABC transport system ATP-binding protein
MRKHQIGFVFQFFHLIPQLTAFENIQLANVIAGEDDTSRVMELLDWVSLTDYKDYFPSQLSGGMQQRVAIARALINEPTVLFADEPTGNLDQKQGHEIMALLKRLNQEKGLTIVLVTHNEDYLQYCSHTLKLIDGEVVDKD